MYKTFLTEARAKKITMKTLPKEIGKLTLYSYEKSRGSYEYTQIEQDEFGDYGDEGEKYNQGLTLEIELEIEGKEIHADTKVYDLGRPDEQSFAKKYSGMVFTTIEELEKTLNDIVKKFDKL